MCVSIIRNIQAKCVIFLKYSMNKKKKLSCDTGDKIHWEQKFSIVLFLLLCQLFLTIACCERLDIWWEYSKTVSTMTLIVI